MAKGGKGGKGSKGDAKDKRAERVEKKRRKREADRSKHNDDEDKQFRSQLYGSGLRILEVDADGNCLFRALGDQVLGRERAHARVRREVMTHEEVASDHFKFFVEDDEPWEDYLARLRRDGEWGGNMELVAAANHFKVHIIVHQLNAPRLEIRSEASDVRRTAHLSYHGESHYNSVRSVDDSGASGDAPVGLPHLDGAPPPAKDDRDWGTLAADYVSQKMDEVVDSVIGDPKPPPTTRNKACPCGSGKRYKKCCRPVDLARKRAKAAKGPAPDPGARSPEQGDALDRELGSLSI